MASILRTLAGQGKGKKKKSSKPKIINAGFEETTVNEEGCRIASVSTDLLEGGSSSSSSSIENADDLKNYLQAEHSALSKLTAEQLYDQCTETQGWEVWDSKENMTISKKKKDDGTVMGRGEVRWIPAQSATGQALYGFDFVEDYLWDDKAKSQYDEFTEKMLVLMEYKGAHFHVVDQVFKGRFGICGREFVILVSKERRDTGTHDVLVVSAVSIPPHHVTSIEALMDPEKLDTFKQLSSKVVRGHCNLAGYLITRDRQTNEHRLIYMNDADVKSKGVPQWIVTRVKLDQLKIVKAIPDCIEQAALSREDEVESNVADADSGTDLAAKEQIDESLESVDTAPGETAKSVTHMTVERSDDPQPQE